MEVPRSSEIFRILIFFKLPLNNYVELSRRLAWYLSNFAFAPQSLNKYIVYLFAKSWYFFPRFSLSLRSIIMIFLIIVIIWYRYHYHYYYYYDYYYYEQHYCCCCYTRRIKKIPSFAKLWVSKRDWIRRIAMRYVKTFLFRNNAVL